LPLAVRHMYSMDDFRLQFGGVRFWGKYGNGAIGECYLQDFATRLRTLANNFFIKHPAILRSATISNDDSTTPSSLDRPSKLLYIANEDYFADILERQECFVMEAESAERQTELRKLLHSKINGMMRRRLSKSLVFGDKWRHLPGLVQDFLGDGFEGRQQYFNVNFTHSPINRHMDKAGFAGSDDFTSAGKAFATMRLEGCPCHIILQEIPNLKHAHGVTRFPVMLSFVTKNFECWGLTGHACYLTHHGVYPSKVPSMGAKDLQPHMHSVLCKDDVGCNMSLTFGSVEPLVCFKWREPTA